MNFYRRSKKESKVLTVRTSCKLHQKMVLVAAAKHHGNMNDCYEAALQTYANLSVDDIKKSLDE